MFWSTLMHASLPARRHGPRPCAWASRPGTCRPPCSVYPDTDEIEEYGGDISLDRWGAMLVSGRDEHGHNKVVDRTLRGTPVGPAAARRP